jgi:hypothetical protein
MFLGCGKVVTAQRSLKGETMKHVLWTLIVAGVGLSAIGTAAAQELTAGQVKSRLQAAGYTNVKNVRREGDHFDAVATGRDGKTVSLDIDAKTGAISREKEGDDEAREENREHGK